MLPNTSMTIYNKITKNRETKYKKSYIYSVHWEDNEQFNILKSGLSNADKTSVYIPFRSCDNYQNPIEFRKSPVGFTLQPEDIIVKGIIEDEFTTRKDLEKNHDYVRVITSVDDYLFGSDLIKHFEVGAN